MNQRIILKSSCIFDSVSDEPFDGAIVIEDSKISEVIKGDCSKTIEANLDAKVYEFGDRQSVLDLLILTPFSRDILLTSQVCLKRRWIRFQDILLTDKR